MGDQHIETTKIACVGETGTLKTVQIRYLIDALGWQNVGIISCERGLSTIESDVRKEQTFICNSLDDFDEALKWAQANFGSIDKWVCIDGGTRLLEWTANKVWYSTDEAYDEIVMKNVPRQQLKGWAAYGSKFITKDGDVEGQRQWNTIASANLTLLNRAIKGEYNLYCTFWREKTQLDQYKKGLPWTVDAPGTGSRNAVYRTMDYVVHLDYDAGKLIGYCDTSSQVYRCKARNDLRKGIEIPKRSPDFNLATFVALLRPQTAAVETQA